MKKIFSFLAMFCLLFMVGGTAAVAQDSDVAWEVDDSSPVTAIETGVNYALRKGTNATFNPSAYLSSDGIELTSLNVTAVYQFEQDGTVTTDGETLPLYILKSVALDQYLGEGGGYVRSRADAFHFTALLAEGYPEDTEWTSLTEMQRRCAVREEPQPGVVGQTFVFASAEPGDDGLFTFMSYYGNPGFWNYFDTNAWFVFPISERPKTASEKMQDAYDNLFGGAGVDETTFPVGSAPGCISQELFNQLLAAYNAYFDVTGNPSATDEEMNAVTDLLNAANEALEAGRIQVTPGYYIMRSQRANNAAYDDGTQILCTGNFEIPEEYTVSNAKYIWEVIDAGNGSYQLRNFATGRYIGAGRGTSTVFYSTEEPQATFTFPWDASKFFDIMDQNENMGHCDGSNRFVQWNSRGAAGNQWEFTPVPAETLADLTEDLAQQRLRNSLASVLSDAKAAKLNHIYKSDVTFDDQYASEGLADPELMKTNAPESGEGYAVADQFKQLSDGNLQTYFHTTWSNNNPTTYHYLEVDLGKAVQHLFVKFSQRHNKPKENNPLYVAFVTNDDPGAEAWTDTLRKDSVVYQYSTNFSAGRRDSSTAVMQIDFEKPVQHLRFVVLGTWANAWHGQGVCWYVSEMRFYENGGANPLYDMIPQQLRDALDQQIAVAEQAMADSAVTQEIIDNLQEAVDAFNEAYPDPTALNNLIEHARELAANAEEGDELGYFQSGAADELTAAIDAMSAEIEGKNLTLDELDVYTQRVQEAIDAFNAKLNVPEDGYYSIQFQNTGDGADSAGAAEGSYVYADNAGEDAGASWAYADDQDAYLRLNTLWQVTRLDNGAYTLRNIGTGRYLQNPYAGTAEPDTINLSQQLAMGAEPGEFEAVFSGTPGVFNLQLADGYYLNGEPTGLVVNWNAQGGNSNLVFTEVDMFDGVAKSDVTADRLNIITVPYPVDAMMTSASLYSVKGLLAGADGTSTVELTQYQSGDVIPAGTPFILDNRDSEETSVMLGLTVFDLDEFATTTEYVYDIVTANGLVSAPSAVTPGAGNGILVDNTIQIANDDDEVPAGSGYFIDRIPATDEPGDLSIPVNGVINAIGGVTLPDAAAEVDVYTLSGVKVRAKVKASEATKGLPAGLYIVGGQKVLVK